MQRLFYIAYMSVLFLYFFFFHSYHSIAADRNAHVLIISSYHHGFGATDPIIDGIKTAFTKSKIDADFYIEYLDSKRFSPDVLFPDVEQLYQSKYSQSKFDVIIVANNNAFNFILDVRDRLFPGTPVVFCGINNFQDSMIDGVQQITGVVEDISIHQTIDLALSLHPQTTHLAVISDSTTTGMANLQKFSATKQDLPKDLNIIDLGGLSALDLTQKLEQLPKHTIVLQLSFYMDKDGSQFTQKEQMALINSHCDKPIYSAWDFFIAHGVIGGVVTYFPLQGETAGEMATEIIEGKPIAQIPVVKSSPNIPLFDYRILNKFKISLSDIPAESVILNMPQSFYHQNKTIVWTVFIFLILQSLAIGLLLVTIQRKRQTEVALSESEEKYRSVFEQASEGIMLINSETGKIIEFNQAAHENLEYSKEEFENLSISSIEAKDSNSKTRLSLQNIDTNDSKSFEARHRTKKDNLRDVVVSSRSLHLKEGHYISWIVHDITDRKNVENSLKQYERIVSATTDLMSFINSDYVYLAVNDAYLKAHQIEADQIIGKTVSEIMGTQLFNENLKAKLDSCLSGETINYKSWFNFTGIGRRYMDITYYPYIDPDNHITGLVVNARDSTIEHEYEEKLRQSQKMEAIGTLAGGIAHDFNNILSAVLGYAEMAKVEVQQGTKLEKNLRQVLYAGNRAKELVQQILSFSRQADSNSIIFAPAGLVKEIMKMLRPAIPSTIQINQDIDSKVGCIKADPTQINQVLLNLCTNAYHVMENTGGTLSVSLNEVEIDSKEVADEPKVQPGKFINLSVSDTGTGIPRDISEKIFDPYFTTKEEGKGTGMGLSIVHGTVKSYGGFITFETVEGEGTTFQIFLPVCHESEMAEDEIKSTDTILTGNERILFVDDETLLGNMGQTMLESLGYKVSVKDNPYDALATFKKQPNQFDLIITDQTMPGMTGAEFSTEILKIRPNTPIILSPGIAR